MQAIIIKRLLSLKFPKRFPNDQKFFSDFNSIFFTPIQVPIKNLISTFRPPLLGKRTTEGSKRKESKLPKLKSVVVKVSNEKSENDSDDFYNELLDPQPTPGR